MRPGNGLPCDKWEIRFPVQVSEPRRLLRAQASRRRRLCGRPSGSWPSSSSTCRARLAPTATFRTPSDRLSPRHCPDRSRPNRSRGAGPHACRGRHTTGCVRFGQACRGAVRVRGRRLADRLHRCRLRDARSAARPRGRGEYDGDGSTGRAHRREDDARRCPARWGKRRRSSGGTVADAAGLPGVGRRATHRYLRLGLRICA